MSASRNAKQELSRLMEAGASHEALFITPKPTGLIQRILKIASNPGDLVLDSFAGQRYHRSRCVPVSAEDGGNRRFILVEMEPKVARHDHRRTAATDASSTVSATHRARHQALYDNSTASPRLVP